MRQSVADEVRQESCRQGYSRLPDDQADERSGQGMVSGGHGLVGTFEGFSQLWQAQLSLSAGFKVF